MIRYFYPHLRMESRLIATGFDQVALNFIKGGLPIAGFIAGGLAYFSLSEAVKLGGMAMSNGNWNVISTICGTIMGYFFWDEQLQTKNFIGLCLGCVSLYLMNGV